MYAAVTRCGLALIALLLSTASAYATGALFVRPLNSSQTHELMSIKTYDATVAIQDQIASTHIDQTFTNKTSARVEATFVFPLPETAVITELIYWFNGQKYRAALRESKAAQQAYNDKIRKYLDPALLQDLGNNVFKLNIAPIEPQSDVRFEITYAELLPYEFGSVEYRFPLKTTGLSPDALERVSLQIDARTGTEFTVFESPSHGNTAENKITKVTPQHYTVTFGDEHFTPSKDFVLKVAASRSNISMNILTYTPSPADSMGTDSFYAMWVPAPDNSTATLARNAVFAADVSSSMEGERLDKLKQAMHVFLDGMTEKDRFNILPFSTNVVAFKPDLVPATPQNIKDARTFVDKLGAAGLTNIDAVLQQALSMTFSTTASNLLVLITDGYPTWGELKEETIVEKVRTSNTQGVRIFPFGVGEDISKKLMTGIATPNGGYATFVQEFDSIPTLVRNFFMRVSKPVLSGLNIDYGGLQVYDVYARQLPDLFWGSQVLQFGRYRNGGSFPVQLTGTAVGEPLVLQQTVDFPTEVGGNRAVARLWANQKIQFLLAEIAAYGEKKELVDAVIDLSIRYGILTPYTALYADPDEGGGTTDVPSEHLADVPRIVAEPAYPNPVRGITSIQFTCPESVLPHAVRVVVYNALGQEVKVLYTGTMGTGTHTVTWDRTDEQGHVVPAGVYFYRIETAAYSVGNTILVQ